MDIDKIEDLIANAISDLRCDFENQINDLEGQINDLKLRVDDLETEAGI